MEWLNPVMAALHALGAVVWVGGMFFAYMILRPTLGGLDGPERLKIWSLAFPKFFGWAWASAITLLISGLWLIFWVFGGIRGIEVHIKLMMGIGILMIFILFYVFSGPYEQFKAAMAKQDGEAAAKYLNRIRQFVLVNLKLGLITAAIGASGRLWG